MLENGAIEQILLLNLIFDFNSSEYSDTDMQTEHVVCYNKLKLKTKKLCELSYSNNFIYSNTGFSRVQFTNSGSD